MSAHSLIKVSILLTLAACYFAASKLGFTMAFEAEQVTLVWPPTGIALAAVLLLGYGMWPGIMLGAFLANVSTNEPVATAFGVALGNTLEAVVAAWMLRRFVGFHNNLSHLKDVLGLVVCSAVLSTMISATIGVTSLCLGGVQPWIAYKSLWLTWWLGDAAGALIFAPALLVWLSQPYITWHSHRFIEAMLLAVTLSAISIGIFTEPLVAGVRGSAFIYLIFPFIIVAALRFGQYGTTLVTLAASTMAIWATLHGFGPFTVGSVVQNLALLQIFMGVVGATGLLLSAAISERRWASEILRESEERFRLMADAAPVLIWMAGTDKKCDYFNKSWLDFTGRSIKQEQGDGWTEGIHPDDLAQCFKTYVNAFDARHPFEMEYRLRHASGEYRWLMDHGTPRFTPQGEFAGYIGSCIDITTRKQAEEALKESDRRKDEFLATLAHELRNPLAPLKNALHILSQPGIEETRRREAQDIMENQLRQMVRLVDDLLDVSRISHGKIELRKNRVLFKDAIHMALETAKPFIDANGLTFSIAIPDAPLWLDADITRLSQIFANLLNNAAKYTKPGGRISLEAVAEGHTLLIKIRDTGIGIAPDMLPRIFDMFTQVDTSIARSHGGLGIGLTLVKKLVEMHGGEITAFSNGINQGSEFAVRLPLVAAPAAAQSPIISQPKASQSQQRKRRVLVVDDNQNLAKTLGWMVESIGHEAHVMYDGTQVLAVARAYSPDVILLDIGLAGTNGYELGKILRQHSDLEHCILIAHTGWGQPEHRQRSKEAGFNYHLVKPVELETLAQLFSSLA
jgi:PAS domain S-box-containing protein